MRRSKWITQKIELATTTCIIVLEEREHGFWMHQFKTRNGVLMGLNGAGEWDAIGNKRTNWKRRVNLLFYPTDKITLFQAVRENGKWRAANTGRPAA